MTLMLQVGEHAGQPLARGTASKNIGHRISESREVRHALADLLTDPVPRPAGSARQHSGPEDSDPERGNKPGDQDGNQDTSSSNRR